MRQALVAALIALAAFAVNAYAQQTPVSVIGAVTAGNCAAFNSTNVLKDAGTTCGGTGGGSVTTSAFASSTPVLRITDTPQVISSAGLVQIGFPNVTSGQFLAGPIPQGATTNPTFRFISQVDLPPIDLSITTAAGGVFNILGTNNGGTGRSNAPAHGILQTTNPNLPLSWILATSPGNLIIDQGLGSDWVTKPITGDCTLAATGAITCTKSGGSGFGTFAFQNFATPPTIGGSVPGIINTSQLQVNGNNMTFLSGGADSFCGQNTNGLCSWTGISQFKRVRTQVIVITSNATAGLPYSINNGADYLICVFKTVGSASSINLPASPVQGDTYVIKDCKGDDNTNNIIVNSAGGANSDNIEGVAAPWTMNLSTATFRDRQAFTWSGNSTMGWILN